MHEERSRGTREGIAETLDRAAVLLVRHISRATSLTSRAALRALREDGPTRLTELACSQGVSQPAMTQLVGRLEREGLVVRLIDPEDARATLVDITESGRAAWSELKESRRERLAELLDNLSPDEEASLGLAMRVALPLIEQLTRYAAADPKPQSAPTGLASEAV
ncbi:transcriptional regulator [Mycobacterium sp. JS623]|jgi:DNA-binding MarR family transcriptional regulator|uniref:MarR family transcriptional regulator n=1 Tax=Mycobacterium sp. JS623 TaxID=212767 RepID=UPI0002A56DBF|nr:MarR family transcriptional regulator [Mycobacterium sp. JS623]AGB22391.1 transcriptional regulator [Mycobacterium sp. JS623]